MQRVRVAAVSRDANARLELARAFDDAPSSWDVSLHETPPPDADVVVRGPDVDGSSGILFDPEDPQGLIPAVERALRRLEPSKVVVVTASGGGVGATSVALHLAREAGRRGEACCIDRPGGGMDLRLDLPDDAPRWSDHSPGSEIKLVAPPIPGGFRVLLADPLDDLTTDAVAAARASFRTVIAERSASALGDVGAARAAVLIMTPTIPSARRAARIIDSRPEATWAVVTNRLGPGGRATRQVLEAALGRRIAVELPTSPGLRDAEDSGRLIDAPLSLWLLGIRRLWRALEGA